MLALDVLLLVMIAVCIVYCWILNQRISDLHNSRVEFARMIKEFDAAVVKAEVCISELSSLSIKATDNVREASSEANSITQELKTIFEIGNNIADKLESHISEARTQLDALASMPVPKSRKKKEVAKAIPTSKEDLFQYSQDEEGMIESLGYREDEMLPEHKSLLETVLNKISTHKHKGTVDQSSYYDSLRKLSVRK